jgi:hypothetical protein
MEKWDKRSVFLIYANYIHVVARQSTKMHVSLLVHVICEIIFLNKNIRVFLAK